MSENTDLYNAALCKLTGQGFKVGKVTRENDNLVRLEATGAESGKSKEFALVHKSRTDDNAKVFDGERDFYAKLEASTAAAAKVSTAAAAASLDGSAPFARCLAADDSNILLEDISKLGYRPGPQLLDFAHAKSALGALARFHAIGKTMVVEEDKQEREGTEPSLDRELLKEVVARYKDEIREGHEEGLAKFVDNIPKLSDESVFPTCTHGNLNSGNLLFKYDEGNKVLDCKLASLGQFRCPSGPAGDLVTLFYTSTENELRYDFGPMLLREYHSELLRQLNSLCVDVNEDVVTADQLYQEFDAAVPAAIAMGLHAVGLMERKASGDGDSDKATLQRKYLAVAHLKEAINRKLI